MNNEVVTFFDTTLRDGEQTPNVSLTSEQKLTIAKALDKLIEDPAYRKKLGTAAQASAKKQFSADVIIPRYEALYQCLP